MAAKINFKINRGGHACRVALLALFGLLPGTRASDIPEAVVPAGVGINIHFTRGHEQDLDLIAAAGIKFVRQDFFWAATEPRRGEYHWAEFDDLVAQLDRRGLHAYFILDYSNPLYEPEVTATNPITGQPGERTTTSPQHPESVAAFAKWAAAAARHFHGHGIVWEIWNEPNISFWKPKPDVTQYTALALATCRAVREADSSATIVGPATSGEPPDFIENFFKSGVLEYLDGVSVHPYRPPTVPPETAVEDYRRVRELIEQYAPEGKKKMPILSGEWGYSSNTKGVSEAQQADFIVRQQLSNLLRGVPISIWYDWKNDGPDPAENEHNFGIVKADLTPKPAYGALQTFTRELAGCRFDHRFDTGNTNDYVLVFTGPGHNTKLAVWTISGVSQACVPLNVKSLDGVTFVNAAGLQAPHCVLADHELRIDLDDSPTYINLRGAMISAAAR